MATNTKTKLIFGDLSYKINGVLFATHNDLGRFAREKQYADMIENKFKQNKINYKREQAVGDSGNIVDFIVEDSIILELKAKPFLSSLDYEQVQRYLHFCDLELGVLVNFRPKYLMPKRILRKRHL
ncbi:MAG: GxxExxY protein [Candidatus Doudnabacteria bacterium CG10_big_fil_rev_8_21_14_0_10_42_18]|uniref:GxxExxY protein n=1 Tax=Candidatus Doudnabacteria bacterium CG10_big_fil_rev_8_21_14_0_10_42_18 TaxID=1974552 RepID=A0A2H0VAZ9_9BACT|nr:MAG: GxxExxY protein [Candidatus Doudnabacteria bacterium CG10_big_fil_rev_8_21_14_0_10_42_18]